MCFGGGDAECFGGHAECFGWACRVLLGGMVSLGWLQGESYHVSLHGLDLQFGCSVFIVFL